MKSLLLFAALVAASFLALLLQEVFPAPPFAGGTHLPIVPVLFCLGAVALPFPLMLLLAFALGAFTDIVNFQFVGNRPEIALGTSVLYYLCAGAVCQGVRAMFLEGAWWVLPVVSVAVASGLPLLQYILISFRRFEGAGLHYSEGVLWRILLPGLFAAALAPCLLLVYRYLSGAPSEGARRPQHP